MQIDDVKEKSKDFESLGENCEFGFALRKLGNEDGQLLRWAVSYIKQLTDFLRRGPCDFFLADRLTPVADDMVRDEITGLMFHTELRFERVGNIWRRTQTPDVQVELYGRDASKIAHMSQKFWDRLRSGDFIYVFKHPRPISLEEEANLYDAFLTHTATKKPTLLIVNQFGEAVQSGSIERRDRYLLRGNLHEFVDNAHFATSSYEEWFTLMHNAHREIKG